MNWRAFAISYLVIVGAFLTFYGLKVLYYSLLAISPFLAELLVVILAAIFLSGAIGFLIKEKECPPPPRIR